MKTGLAIFLTLLLGLVSAAQAQHRADRGDAKLIGYITLPNVEGWMDHMAVDVQARACSCRPSIKRPSRWSICAPAR